MTTLKSVTVTIFPPLQMPDLQKRIEELGSDPVGSAPEEFDRLIAADMKNWAKITKDAHIPLE